MSERPIIFSRPMVLAILEDRKFQTRRIVNPQPPAGTAQVSTWHHPDPRPHFFASADGEFLDGWCLPCPYGKPGDRLWVRETWRGPLDDGLYGYRATHDGPFTWESYTWRPSIHMPRIASRILLEITGIRVERLNDISDAGPSNDCTEEGVFHCGMECPTYEEWYGNGFRSVEKFMYRKLWEQINGAGSWAANQFVWVVAFKRVKP